ncbi:DUF4870 domain-containing protein [Janibacter melonis]|uniref:DUF4870 domain-containing protein n=1 Tax=Janibacter melonis TaxID=262209 RepID=UPI0020438A34|nr:DUF4870 domain-containing protein [Janibacter melonis]MCM3553957.1 DUF4870 domain-containing protein [Janibacter melonis]
MTQPHDRDQHDAQPQDPRDPHGQAPPPPGGGDPQGYQGTGQQGNQGAPHQGYQGVPQQGVPQPWQQQQVLSPQDQRNYGMLAHLAPAIAIPLSAGTLGFVASLVVYLMYKDRGDFVRAHAVNSLNVQIVTAIGLILSTLLMVILIGFITYPLICVVAVVIHVIGASKARNGELWSPPLTPAFVR